MWFASDFSIFFPLLSASITILLFFYGNIRSRFVSLLSSTHTQSIYLFQLFIFPFPLKSNPIEIFFKDSSRWIHRIWILYGSMEFFFLFFFFVRFVHENATKYCTCVYSETGKRNQPSIRIIVAWFWFNAITPHFIPLYSNRSFLVCDGIRPFFLIFPTHFSFTSKYLSVESCWRIF